MEFFEQVRQTFQRMDARMTRMEGRLDVAGEELRLLKVEMTGLREDLQDVGGAFAGIEAMLGANAARMQQHEESLAGVLKRIEALERRAS